MFNSFPFSNINTTPLFSPLFSNEIIMPSPFFCNEMEDFDYFLNNHDSYTINEGLISSHNNDFNSNLTDDSSIVDHKINEKMTHNFTSSSTNKKKKKRNCNKDRHSKIKTLHGLRDRRMRLSLQVAQPFFQLQDMLGFDKASKTIEWLLIKSSSAIEELYHGSPSGVQANYAMSSTSEDCEVQSKVLFGGKKESCKAKDEGRVTKRKRFTKEERKEARDRARKRTLEKERRRVENNNDINCLEEWIPSISSLCYQ